MAPWWLGGSGREKWSLVGRDFVKIASAEYVFYVKITNAEYEFCILFENEGFVRLDGER